MQPKHFTTSRGRYVLEYDVHMAGAHAKLTSPEGSVTIRPVRSENDLLELVETTGMATDAAERIARTEWVWVGHMLDAEGRAG